MAAGLRRELYRDLVSSSAPRDRGVGAAASLRRMEQASLSERRRRYRETTMSERIEAAFELSELARELNTGLRTPR